MSVSFEWGSGGSDLAVVPASEYADSGIFTEDEPGDDQYALVIGGESGGGYIVEDNVAGLAEFAERMMTFAVAAHRLETAISRTVLAEWAGRPLTDDDVLRLRKWFARRIGPQVWALVTGWDTDTPLLADPDVNGAVYRTHANQLGDWCWWSGQRSHGANGCPAMCPDSYDNLTAD